MITFLRHWKFVKISDFNLKMLRQIKRISFVFPLVNDFDYSFSLFYDFSFSLFIILLYSVNFIYRLSKFMMKNVDYRIRGIIFLRLKTSFLFDILAFCICELLSRDKKIDQKIDNRLKALLVKLLFWISFNLIHFRKDYREFLDTLLFLGLKRIVAWSRRNL